eukprot:gene14061-15528_t
MAMANNSEASNPGKVGRGIDIFKFPRTMHVLDAGGSNVSRDDLVMSKNEAKIFIKGKTITVEEKIDGANIGISLSDNYQIVVQNRSHYVSSSTHRQFGPLDKWISDHSDELYKILDNGTQILFGEWLYAKHSILYTNLPSYFIAFDIYNSDKKKFLSSSRRDKILQRSGIATVPLIDEKQFKNVEELLSLLQTPSKFYDGPVEGIYLRINDDKQKQNDVADQGFLLNRAKIVRPGFIQNIEAQWTRQKFTKNICSIYY